ncbi:hypothetical protein B566_EDAN011600 [Ephemera danica]|nr:hypothetical protein B566_EDAN011600 [Ephemera danica]
MANCLSYSNNWIPLNDIGAVAAAGIPKMENFPQVLDPRKQELLEARFLGTARGPPEYCSSTSCPQCPVPSPASAGRCSLPPGPGGSAPPLDWMVMAAAARPPPPSAAATTADSRQSQQQQVRSSACPCASYTYYTSVAPPVRETKTLRPQGGFSLVFHYGIWGSFLIEHGHFSRCPRITVYCSETCWRQCYCSITDIKRQHGSRKRVNKQSKQGVAAGGEEGVGCSVLWRKAMAATVLYSSSANWQASERVNEQCGLQHHRHGCQQRSPLLSRMRSQIKRYQSP